MIAEPQSEHRWLSKLVGESTLREGDCSMGARTSRRRRVQGVEVVRSLGGLWAVGEGEGGMPGGGASKTIMTLGYDPQPDASWGRSSPR